MGMLADVLMGSVLVSFGIYASMVNGWLITGSLIVFIGGLFIGTSGRKR